jgi:hypothetical protein
MQHTQGTLEDLALAVYCAIDDALKEAGVLEQQGKLIPRRGPPPDVSDTEVLALCLIQELMGFESDNSFALWLEANATMTALFPRRLSRQNFADRRLLLLPLIQTLCRAFAASAEPPPFSSWTATPWMSAAPSATTTSPGSRAMGRKVIALRSSAGLSACASI